MTLKQRNEEDECKPLKTQPLLMGIRDGLVSLSFLSQTRWYIGPERSLLLKIILKVVLLFFIMLHFYLTMSFKF